jgi:hypothetical protein
MRAKRQTSCPLKFPTLAKSVDKVLDVIQRTRFPFEEEYPWACIASGVAASLWLRMLILGSGIWEAGGYNGVLA